MEYTDFGPSTKSIKFTITYLQIIPYSGFKQREITETIRASDKENALRKFDAKKCKEGKSYTLVSIKEV